MNAIKLQIRTTIVFSIVSFILFSTQSFASSRYACQSLFSNNLASEEAVSISHFLKDNRGTSDKSTVTWIDHFDHKVIFSKNKNDFWLSRHNAFEESLTAEGDLRLPMFLMGPELAAKMGFAIHEYPGNLIEVIIPDSDLLALNAQKINLSLKSRSIEPITYLPVRTGYITIEDGMNLALSARGDYLIHFPYADEHKVLVPHEASFHLGAMMLPSKVMKRARLITQETADFLNLLKTHEKDLGAKTQELVDQIMLERVFENDAGFASLVTTPAHARRDNGMKSYSEIYTKITDKSWFYMTRDMEYLNRPNLQAYEAVLVRLQIMTGIDLSEYIRGDASGFVAFSIPDQNIGNKVSLNAHQAAILKQVVANYMQKPHVKSEITSPRKLAEGYILYLDQRIKDMIASF